jgi:hypothetical protein
VKINPITHASIRLHPEEDPLNGRHTGYVCGCHVRHRDGEWNLCQYHRGFNDAVEQQPTPEAYLIGVIVLDLLEHGVRNMGNSVELGDDLYREPVALLKGIVAAARELSDLLPVAP